MNIVRTCLQIVAGALLLLLTGVVDPAVAQAQQGDKALAESLFEAGRALMKKGQYAAACPRFEESQRQDPSPGTLINLGECYKALGKTATAWADFKAAVALAANRGRAAQEQLARQRAAALGPTLSRVTLQQPAEVPPGLQVKLDGRDLGVASLGVAFAVDPGEHTLLLVAPGYQTVTEKFKVGAQANQIVLPLPALVEAPGQPAATPGRPVATPALRRRAPAGPAPAPAGVPVGGDRGTGAGPGKVIGFVVGGVGIAALGVGAVFGLMASSQASSAKSDPTLCPDKVCTPAGRGQIDSARSKALVSTVGIGVGAGALVVGTLLVLVSGPSSGRAAAPRSARLVPLLGPGGGQVMLTGSF